MKFIFKLLIIFFLLIISFIYGVYIGIVDNNYIHDKKRLLLNGKTIASYYLKRLNYSIDKINIDLSKENERLIQRQIDKALKNKIINKDSISWVKAKISTNQIKTSGKIKIKGMFLDDFEKEERQFSYSVKMKKPFNGLTHFNLHYPEKRLKLYEWYGDKLLEELSLIYHKNNFAVLSINKEKKGLYLIEEKYNKNLLKNNNREFGPIIYFSKKQLRDFNYDFIESFNNAEINAQFPHKKNSRAIELLEGYRRGKLNPEQVFNFEKTSTLFAISELVGYVHHLQFHNIKFYYNAREDRLEPIANDFQFDFLNKWTRETIFLAGLKKNNNYILLPWAENLYKSQKFISLIIKKLKIFTSSDFLDSFFKSINADEEKAKILISGFDPLYIPDVKEKMNKNSQQLNHIINFPPNLEIAISRKEKKIIYKSLSYLPIIALSINKDSNVLYKFEKNKNLRLNNFGEVPLRDTINLKNINLEMLNKELTLKYKITGKTTAQYQQIHITD